MKKALFLLLTGVLLSALVGCQAPNEELPPVIDETTAQATETEKTPPKDTEALTEVETEPQAKPVTKPQTEPVTEPVTEPETEQPTQNDDAYCAFTPPTTLEEYLHDSWERQFGQEGNAELNSQNRTVSTLVPVLKNSDYEFIQLDKIEYVSPMGNIDAVRWYYYPVARRSDRERPLGLDPLALIYFEVGGTQEWHDYIGDMHNADITSEEYSAYFVQDTWRMKIDGYYVSVHLTDPDALGEIYPFGYEKVFEYFDFEIVTYSPTAETGAVQ